MFENHNPREVESKNIRIRIIRTALWVFLFIAIFFSSFQVLKYVTGTSNPMLVVVSGSMEPFLYRGDIIFIQRVDVKNLRVGDVIVFLDPYGRAGSACRLTESFIPFLWNSEEESCRIVHRIIEVTSVRGEVSFRTKGDNNYSPDPWTVTEELYEGRYVFHIPLIGHVTLLLKPPTNYIVILILLVLIVITDIWPLRRGEDVE